jgi:hypothetical protein
MVSFVAVALVFGVAPAAEASASRHIPGQPATFVAARDGTIVEVSSATGRVVRTLTTRHPGGGDSQPYLSDNGRTVVFSRGAGTCSAGIWSISRQGGPTRALVPADGVASGPKLSRDGELLAYQYYDCAAARTILKVQTLKTGATDSIMVLKDRWVADYTFTPDRRRLIVIIASGTGSRMSTQVRSVRVGTHTAAAGWALRATGRGCHATGVTRIGRSAYLAVSEYCPATGWQRVLKVNNHTGHVVGLITQVKKTKTALSGGIDFDAAGRHLLLHSESGTIYTVQCGIVTPVNTVTTNSSATW